MEKEYGILTLNKSIKKREIFIETGSISVDTKGFMYYLSIDGIWKKMNTF